jgi:hypothetical protein
VERSAPTTTYDPDLDPPRPRARIGSGGWPPRLPQEYQRLVANPFLALLGLIVWFAVMEQALRARSILAVWLAMLGLAVVAYLLQYHCLDCGATGTLFRWRSHACERVRIRRETGQVRYLRGPNPVFQTFAWLLLMVVLAILIVPVLLLDLP